MFTLPSGAAYTGSSPTASAQATAAAPAWSGYEHHLYSLEGIMFDKTTHLAKDMCPACGYGLDAATGFDNETPKPNNLTVCVNCAFILVFDERLKVRKASRQDLADLDAKTREKLCLILGAVDRYKYTRPSRN